MNRPDLTADQALTVFRGWSESQNEFMYGTLDVSGDFYCIIEIGTRHNGKVDKDSIGIFTGQLDKNKQPIFASIPGARYGDDTVKYYQRHWNAGGASGYEYGNIKFVKNDTLRIVGFQIPYNCEIIGTQWEEHLKDTKCKK